MPFTLQLPYAVCYPATRLARRLLAGRAHPEAQDQAVYFETQYRTTYDRFRMHMEGVDLKDKVVFDVGCGLGGRSLAWIDLGAKRVVNVDINRQELEVGRDLLARHYPDRLGRIDHRHPSELSAEAPGDVAILFDVFEHLVDPASVLREVDSWLRPGGLVWIGSIGWYNYRASHCTGGLIPIPWCQVLFSEAAIIRTIRTLLHSPDYVPNVWDRLYGLDRWDSVSTLRDRPGEPLNLLSLRRIRAVLRETPFRLEHFRVHGYSGKSYAIARLASLLAHAPVLQEVFHSYYTALLKKPQAAPLRPTCDGGRRVETTAP